MLPIATGYMGYTPIQFYEMTPLEFLIACRGYNDRYKRDMMVKAKIAIFTAMGMRSKHPPSLKKVYNSLTGADQVNKPKDDTADKLRGLLSGATTGGMDREGALKRRYELARSLNKKRAEKTNG